MLAAVSCQTWATPACVKLARLIVAGVRADRDLLIDHHRQRAVAERCAAKAETVSGLGTVAETLVSPNVDLLPS